MLGRWPRFVNYDSMRETAMKALARLGVTLDVDRPLKDYAIAQRQIVAIARALIGEAKLVFMDEPTASLTQSETDHLLDIVRTLSASGVAVVFVSHRLAEVLEISSRLTVLRDGALVGVYPTNGMTQSRITELMTGKTFDQTIRARDVSAQSGRAGGRGSVPAAASSRIFPLPCGAARRSASPACSAPGAPNSRCPCSAC